MAAAIPANLENGHPPSTLDRWMLRLIATAVISGGSIAGTLAWQAMRPLPTVPLTVGLGGEWAEASAELDRRVQAMFPLGSTVADMGTKLERQGFRRIDWGSSPAEEHRAMRREDRLACAVGAYVYWRDDGNGSLTHVRGAYNEEGCL